MKHTVISNSIEETLKIGYLLGKMIKSNIVIGLDGDMGCGKTHLVKGIAKGLDIKNTITSPTFNLVNEYNNGSLDLYHFDVYRITSLDELFLIGFDDYLKNNAAIIIEWSLLIKDILPKETNYINIESLSENQRNLEFNFSKKYENILLKLTDYIK